MLSIFSYPLPIPNSATSTKTYLYVMGGWIQNQVSRRGETLIVSGARSGCTSSTGFTCLHMEQIHDQTTLNRIGNKKSGIFCKNLKEEAPSFRPSSTIVVRHIIKDIRYPQWFWKYERGMILNHEKKLHLKTLCMCFSFLYPEFLTPLTLEFLTVVAKEILLH